MKLHGFVTVFLLAATLANGLPAIHSIGDVAKMPQLPADAAEVLKKASLDVAQYATNNIRKIVPDGKSTWELDQKLFEHKMKGFISDEAMDDIKMMGYNCAWYAARARFNGDSKEKAKNLAEQDRLHQKLKTYDFWTLDLVENIYTVVMRAAWYAANKAKGYPDANDDLDVVNKATEAMSTSVYIKSMTFIKDQASILEEHPVVAFSMEINNEFNIPQEMDKQFSHTMQKTLSAGLNIGFQASVEMAFEVNEIFEKEDFKVNLQFSVGATFEASVTKSVTETFDWKLTVPPHCQGRGEASATEGTANLPYTLVLGFGTTDITKHGVWQGVTTGTMLFHTFPENDNCNKIISFV